MRFKDRQSAIYGLIKRCSINFIIPFGIISFFVCYFLYLSQIQVPFLNEKMFYLFIGYGLCSTSIASWLISRNKRILNGLIERVSFHFFISSQLAATIGLIFLQQMCTNVPNFYFHIFQSILFIIMILSGIFIIFFANDSQKNSSNHYITKKLHITFFLLIFILFLIIQIYKLYHTGIGTDEGNFLYAAKLINDGKQPFIDFFVRESGSLFFLTPWFKVLSTTILNLRFEILLVHLGILFTIYNTLTLFTKNKLYLLITLLITSILFQFNGFLDFFSGSFIQISNLLGLINLNILIRYIKKPGSKLLIINALILGISILVYKGSQVFLIMSIVYLFLGPNDSNEEKDKAIYKTLVFSFLPIFIYFAYYSLKTDFYHIYRMLLNDVISNYLAFTLLYYGLTLLRKIKKINTFLQDYLFQNTDNLVLITNFVVFLAFIYSYVQTPSGYYGFYESIYSGFIACSFLIITIQLANLFIINKYKKLVALAYFIFNTTCLIEGYGNGGYYLHIEDSLHIAIAIIFIIYNLFLLRIFFENKVTTEKRLDDENITVIGINIFIVILLIGAYINAFRLQSIALFFPILFILLLEKSTYKKILNYLVFPSLVLFLFINVTKENTYTLSSYADFENMVQYAATLDPQKKVFSFDTAILGEIKNPNEFGFTSPFSFIDRFHQLRDLPDYQNKYPNIKTKYPSKDISLTTDEIFARAINADYVISSANYTDKMLAKYDLAKGITLNEILEFSSGNWKIYRINK